MPRYRTVERRDDVRTAKRLFAIGGVFACCFGVLISRAVSFHLKANEQVEKIALRQYRTAVRQSTERGKILDRLGRELAIDVAVDSIYANPREVEEPVEVASKLAEVLSVDRRKLLDRFATRRKFMWVKRRVSEKEAERVREMGIKGLYAMRESKRFYPNNKLAAPVLGAVGFDAEPLGGVELFYNDVLSWRGRSGDFRRDARGHLYLSPVDEEGPMLAEVELSIDTTLQYISERELGEALRSAKANSGTALVVDVRTGEILAMASLPSFDPNEYGRYPLDRWKNRAAVDAYEPGSTFKVIVIAAAIEAGLVTSGEVIDCENGKIRIGDNIIRDAHPHGNLSVADVIKVSSNIGALKVEQRLGQGGLYDALSAFGFGKKSGADLPGESAGIMSSPRKWSELQYATIAFGQGIAATPIQMVMAFAAIANGGELLRPYIVRRVLDKDGEVIESRNPEVSGRPISHRTAAVMRDLLVRVGEEGGTGTLAASAEYTIAGKTGTAQKAKAGMGGYIPGKYYSSFVGFAPADDPRIAVYVGIDEPGGKFYYGGQVAAPVFRRIVEKSLQYLKVPGKPGEIPESVQAKLPPKAASGELASVECAEDTVSKGGDSLFGAKEMPTLVEGGERMWRLPDLRGLTMRGVLTVAGDAEVDWNFLGTGLAVGQSPPPGSIVSSGEKCTVEFRPLL